MSVTLQTNQSLAQALEDHEGKWELHQGRLREKPAMSFTHNEVMTQLGFMLTAQLPRDKYIVRINTGRLKRADVTYYIPDVFVIPRLGPNAKGDSSHTLEIYDEPALLVVEVWSPSTGGYDVDAKLPEYQSRGDLEIWRVYPADKTVTIWTRASDGAYSKRTVSSGVIQPHSLQGVEIRVADLFAYL